MHYAHYAKYTCRSLFIISLDVLKFKELHAQSISRPPFLSVVFDERKSSEGFRLYRRCVVGSSDCGKHWNFLNQQQEMCFILYFQNNEFPLCGPKIITRAVAVKLNIDFHWSHYPSSQIYLPMHLLFRLVRNQHTEAIPAII